MEIRSLGLTDFDAAFSLQEAVLAAITGGTAQETLLLLEHPPIYTIGSGGDLGNLLDGSIQARRINRGGDITYHGPGQLLGYPLMDLSRRGRDLHRYLRFLEQVLIQCLADFHVAGFTVAGRTGVWTAGGKIASIGVGVRRWVTMHGFALNISNDLSPFYRINPCGMAGCPITSLTRETGAPLTVDEVAPMVGDRFRMLADRLLPTNTDHIALPQEDSWLSTI